MPNNELLLQISRLVKRELQECRESLTYYDIEAFVGSILARMLQEKIITKWEESILRERIIGR